MLRDGMYRCDRCGTSSSSPVCVRPGCRLEGVEEQLAIVTAERDRLVRAVNDLEHMLDGGIRYGNEDNPVDRLRWGAQNVNTTIALSRQNDDLRASLKSVIAERDALYRIAETYLGLAQGFAAVLLGCGKLSYLPSCLSPDKIVSTLLRDFLSESMEES